MPWPEFFLRTATVMASFALIAYVLWAGKPVGLVSALLPIVVAALSGDWSRAGAGTAVVDMGAIRETE